MNEMPSSPSPFEKGLTVFALIIFSGSLDIFYTLNSSDFTQAYGKFYFLFTLGVVALLLFYFLSKPIVSAKILVANWLFTPILLIALASTRWASVQDASMLAVKSLALTTLAGVYLGLRYSAEERIRLLAWCFGIVTLATIGFYLYSPKLATMANNVWATPDQVDNWRGTFSHKNVLGAMMAFSILIFFVRIIAKKGWFSVNVSFLFLSSVCLFMSHSTSARIAALGVCVFFCVSILLRRYSGLAAPIVLAVVLLTGAGVSLAVTHLDTVTAALGKSSDLTGRKQIWSGVLWAIKKHSLVGYGIGSFWPKDTLSPSSPEASMVRVMLKWPAVHAHNGWLETMLSLGLLGIVALTLSLFRAALGAFKHLQLSSKIPSALLEGCWPFTFFIFMLLHNLTEVSFLQPRLLWLVYIAEGMAVTAYGKAYIEKRLLPIR